MISVDTYPLVPKPAMVEVREVSKKGVETTLMRVDRYPLVPSPATVDCNEEASCVEDMYPTCPNPATVDLKEVSRKGVETTLMSDERYPTVPNPCTVLAILLFKPTLLIKLADPRPTTVDANSVGSMKDDIVVKSPIVVL